MEFINALLSPLCNEILNCLVPLPSDRFENTEILTDLYHQCVKLEDIIGRECKDSVDTNTSSDDIVNLEPLNIRMDDIKISQYYIRHSNDHSSSTATIAHRWADVLRNIVENINELSMIESASNWDDSIQKMSTDLWESINKLRSAAKSGANNIYAAKYTVAFLDEAFNLVMAVIKLSKDPLTIIYAAAILFLTSFFKESGVLFLGLDEHHGASESDMEISEEKMMEEDTKQTAFFPVESTKENQDRPPSDEVNNVRTAIHNKWLDSLQLLESKEEFITAIRRAVHSKIFLTESQWVLTDAVLELSALVGSCYHSDLANIVHSFMSDVLAQYNSGNRKISFIKKTFFPQPGIGQYFSTAKLDPLPFFKQRGQSFIGKAPLYYVKGGLKDHFSKDGSLNFELPAKLSWTEMSYKEQLLLCRMLANRSTLNSITFNHPDFSDSGAKLCARIIKGDFIIQRLRDEDRSEMSSIMYNLGMDDDHLWEYIENDSMLNKAANATKNIDRKFVTEAIEKHLIPFRQLHDWKSIMNAPTVKVGRYAKTEPFAIRRIYLSHCNISAVGMRYLTAALAINQSVTTLSLDHNQLGSKGGLLLGAMLAVNCSIVELDVSHNSLERLGMLAVVSGWELNKDSSALQSLDVSHNGVSLSTLELDETVDIDCSVAIAEIKETINVACFV